MKNFKYYVAAFGTSILMPFTHILAQGSGPGSGPVGSGPGSSVTPFTTTFPNPFKTGSTLTEFLITVLNDIVIPIGGVVVVLLIIYSGFLFVTARGNQTQLTKAKENLLYVVIGATIVLGAWAIAQVIQSTVAGLTS